MRKLIFILIIPLILLCGCNSSTHVHNWSNFVDYDESYHYKVCEEDSSHIEKEEHDFVYSRSITTPTESEDGIDEYKCSKCGRKKNVVVSCEKNTKTYDLEVVDDKYLKERTSSCSAIYYKSNEDGEFGNENCVFEHTELSPLYQELEYIESTGTQFIDTGVYFNKNSRIESVISFTSHSIGYNFMFGNWSQTCAFSLRSDCYVCACLNNQDNQTLGNKTLTLEKKYEISVIPGQGIMIDDNLYSLGSYDIAENTIPFLLFGASSGEDVSHPYAWGSYGQGRIYSFKIYENDVLVRDFIPVYSILRNEIGLLDYANNKFYGNAAGSSKFNGGNAVENNSLLPSAYTQLEYLESNGNEYIDTKYKPNANTNIDVSYCINDSMNNKNMIYGSALTSCSDNAFECYVWDGRTQVNVDTSNYFSTIVSKKQRLCIDDSYINIYDENNNLIATESKPESPNCSNSLYLFALHRSTKIEYSSGVKIYEFKVSENGILIHHYLPVIRNSDDKYGMYDIIDQKFHQQMNKIDSFTNGPIGGHDEFEITNIVYPTIDEKGYIEYKCPVCGYTYQALIPSLAYKVTFIKDENVESIYVKNINSYEECEYAYSRNINTYNYSKVDSNIVFKIKFKEGYELDYMQYTYLSITKEDDTYICDDFYLNDTIKIYSKLSTIAE